MQGRKAMKIIENNSDYLTRLTDNCEYDCYLCEVNSSCGLDSTDPDDRPAPSCYYD